MNTASGEMASSTADDEDKILSGSSSGVDNLVDTSLIFVRGDSPPSPEPSYVAAQPAAVESSGIATKSDLEESMDDPEPSDIAPTPSEIDINPVAVETVTVSLPSIPTAIETAEQSLVDSDPTESKPSENALASAAERTEAYHNTPATTTVGWSLDDTLPTEEDPVATSAAQRPSGLDNSADGEAEVVSSTQSPLNVLSLTLSPETPSGNIGLFMSCKVKE